MKYTNILLHDSGQLLMVFLFVYLFIYLVYLGFAPAGE